MARAHEFWKSMGWIPSLGFFLIALFIVAVMPAAVGNISFQIEKNAPRTIFWCFFGAVMIFPIVFFLIISIAGIVMIPIYFIFIGFSMMLGYIAVAQLIGKRISITLRRPNRHIL
jgi:hypothetical protein